MYQTVGAEMSTKRMGGMGKLSDFGKTTTQPQAKPEQVVKVAQPEPEIVVSPTPQKTDSKQIKVVTVNIKIPRDLHNWLSETAQAVRDNNESPVVASDRVFPQHLIGVAIDLLKNTSVDWEQIKTVDDLRQHLKL